MARTTTQSPPPTEVLVEFLHSLQQTVTSYDRIVPVLRGSVLLQHWFGDAARPAADIDLEWFPQPDWRGRSASPIEHARNLCMFAVGDHHGSPIAFDENVPVPEGGVNLWDYGTPGGRCYTGWTWTDRNLRGLLQVDIAQPGSYDLAGIAGETIELPRAWGEPARFLAYTPETLLAAKLSWIVRHVQTGKADGDDQLTFLGEPKDLFDAHLLLTEGNLRPEVFQNALLAVALEDKLDWDHMDVLLDPGLAVAEDDGFPNWTEFSARHEKLSYPSPAEMLRTVIARLRPLLGDLRQHLPFLRAILADPVDEANLLIYADWLDERGDPRADFLRLYCRFFIHEDRKARGMLASFLSLMGLPPQKSTHDRTARGMVASSLSAQPGGWLYYVFGGAERSRDLRKRIEGS